MTEPATLDLPVHLQLTIPGQPVAKARPRHGVNGRVYTPRSTTVAEDDIAKLARAEIHRTGRQPAAGPVEIHVAFYVQDRRRRDVDNLLKTVLDGLNGEAWGDDSQVAHADTWVIVDRTHPRTEITVRLLPGVPFAIGEPVKPPRKKRAARIPKEDPATVAGRQRALLADAAGYTTRTPRRPR